jgi:alanine dehydrogenase
MNAAKMAVGLHANVTILERSLDRIRVLEDLFGSSAQILYSTTDSIERHVFESDLVIGAVLVPGAVAPKLLRRDMLSKMRKNAVFVDIAIDQGGCSETSKATTHEDPVFNIDGVLHYCVANMPGAVAKTSAQALNNAILPYALELANKGWVKALRDNPHLLNGLNVCKGQITCKEVAHDLNLDFVPPNDCLAA